MAAPQTVHAIDYRPPSIVREAYGCYRNHFALVVKLMAGPVAIAVGVAWVVRETIISIMPYLPPLDQFGGGRYAGQVFELEVLTDFKYVVQWLCYCFAFVAICYAVHKVRDGEQPGVADCNNVVRERPGRFLASALVLSLIVWLGIILTSVLALPLFSLQHRLHIAWGRKETIWVTYALLVLVTPVIVRFAFTVPVAVMEDLPVIAALKRADRLSDWRILPLTRLVIESEVAGFVAVYFVYWIVGVSGWRGGPGLPFYLSIALAGFAQAPMLIGMAMLLCQAKEDPRILAPS